MGLRTLFGTAIGIAAISSLTIYFLYWFGFSVLGEQIWSFCAWGTVLIFVSGAISSQILKPHYKVDRVLQIPKLRPFFTDFEYKSIWAVFIFDLLALAICMIKVSLGTNSDASIVQAFTAVWFGSLFVDTMILLRAKVPDIQTQQA